MTSQVWGTPELGTYFIRYAGHDLEVRRVPKSGKGSPERQYQVTIDGILADMAWSTTDAKTKAIKIAERAHRGEPILSYTERLRGKGSPLNHTEPKKLPEAVSIMELEPVVTEPEPPKAIGTVLSNLVAGMKVSDLASITNAAKLFRADAETCGCQGNKPGVSFTLTGTLDMDATDALNTIRAAVELLREHGQVEANAVVPNRIKF